LHFSFVRWRDGLNSKSKDMNEKIKALIQLSHEIGREDRQLAILGEGNTSVKLNADQFAVKASGCHLGTLTQSDVTVCDSAKVLALLNRKTVTDEEIDQHLLEARVDSNAKKPSVEAMFHAWLLSLRDVHYVGHCHSVAANQVLCSPRARDFAERRLFPDEVVCCGPASVFVPYADPGLPLARDVAERTRAFVEKEGYVPRLILLQNHGIIALGSTPSAVLACLFMATKAAAIFAGAAAMGGPNFLTPQHVERIAGRPDEAYRQRQLQI
jgi:rhamnose utilization protein RhaD (predicted bifunctional aldolase and dehydrogenase)